MEPCLSPWDDAGLVSTPNKSLWPAVQVAPMSVERDNAEDAAKVESSHDHRLMLEKLISQQLVSCSTWPTEPFCSGDMVKEPCISERNLCVPSEEYSRKTVAIKRIVKEGTSNCKRSLSSVVAGNLCAASSRVRARRGEATDKHSISERTRRTKITERMKALHRLMPEANKTNKASMLDEVIQYVSMLQARLKMECMRKLDARSCGTPSTNICGENSPMDKEGWRRSCNRMYVNRMIERVLDPLEDRLAEAERQVMSRLSHPSDHSLAANYLASAGLALLPISQLPSLLPPKSNSSTNSASSSHVLLR